MTGFIVFIMACSDKVVSVYNQEPTISISSHADGDSISAGVATTFQAVVGDLNHDLSLLGVRWLSPSGEVCANTAPDASGESSCIYTPTQADIWIRAQVVDPDGALGEDQVDFNVLSNTAPIISILTPQTNAQLTEGEMVLFQAMVKAGTHTETSCAQAALALDPANSRAYGAWLCARSIGTDATLG